MHHLKEKKSTRNTSLRKIDHHRLR